MIPTEQPHLIAATMSHPGETGKDNEDRFSVSHYRLAKEKTPVLLAIVADGIGGHQAGEVAAQLATDTVVRALTASAPSEPVAQLQSAVLSASRAIQSTAREATGLEGMGSTIAVAWIIGTRLYTVNVGDSRIYLMRRGELRQISTDHTWVQEAIDHHIIKPEEARNHPNAHVLRRHLGGVQDPQPDVRLRLTPGESDSSAEGHQGLPLEAGDQLLLCSDGLTDLVEDHEILAMLISREPSQAVREVVDLARSRGGFDNITVVQLVVPASAVKPPRRRRRGILAGMVGGLLLIVIVLTGMAAAWWAGFWPWSPPPKWPTAATTATMAIVIPDTPTPEATRPPLRTPTPSPMPSATGIPTSTSTPIPLPVKQPTQP